MGQTMAGRPKKPRTVHMVPEYVGFDPEGIGETGADPLVLAQDELEAVRLVDLEGLDQAEAAEHMGVARATVAGICQSARRKIADALVNGRRLEVAGGNVRYVPCDVPAGAIWPRRKGEADMRIAATYENGEIFPHFGRTEQFKVYDVEDGRVTSTQVVGSDGVGHGALAGLLAQGGVDVLVCGGIGGGALSALAQQGIRVYAGASGSADAAVEALLAGTLPQVGEATCAGHGSHEGGCGHHGGCCH
ncbi:MAG: DUF134 domain-containing protein [Atopobiaceae bacterium]|nr:DUF134 domain-containing protein [Atopobiaceae bacterium]